MGLMVCTYSLSKEYEVRQPLFIYWLASYILAILPPPGREDNFCPNWKTGKNLKESLKKGKGKGRKEEKGKVIKHSLKYLYEA